jgi:RNA polymerase sigma-70 factor (ECF subfamily)
MMADPSAGFEPHRRRLLGLAYRMLGSMAEAEDAVQEAYLRWHGADRDKIVEPRAFLITTTTRICLDVLKSARARREEYVGPWLPDPITDTAALAPDTQTELAEDLSVALLLALERLSPLERAAFLLHDVFDYSFTQVADALGRNEGACRQLASRARTRVREARPASAPAAGRAAQGSIGKPAGSDSVDGKHAELLSAFIAASRSGNVTALSRLLADDAKLVTDSGGKVTAALNVLEGSQRVAAFLAGVVRKGWTDNMTVRVDTINGLPGLIVSGPEGLIQTNAFEIEGAVVKAIYVVRNPDKLKHLNSF